MGNTPNIRFKGFTDDWEQRKLGESVSITSGEAPSKFEVGTELYVSGRWILCYKCNGIRL